MSIYEEENSRLKSELEKLKKDLEMEKSSNQELKEIVAFLGIESQCLRNENADLERKMGNILFVIIHFVSL